ncbi:hypothetical protein Y032_0028g1724 [Ancylostoma ceylanicum]|uniref:Uncharacterized protein n=1 Tax=Ancylostoma ceylanicum TaxID=53326 RepID=A0A016UTQ4_9BILA|nr:hypothetical protein Y032_0028g1724 [Ancylostoma ceylanicum]
MARLVVRNSLHTPEDDDNSAFTPRNNGRNACRSVSAARLAACRNKRRTEIRVATACATTRSSPRICGSVIKRNHATSRRVLFPFRSAARRPTGFTWAPSGILGELHITTVSTSSSSSSSIRSRRRRQLASTR